MKITTLFCLLLLTSVTFLSAQPKTTLQSKPKEVLLLGTFHYHNPGADVAKTKSFDILSPSAQKDLDKMTKQLVNYNPTKIFVEWPHHEQKELDSLYNLYKAGNYFKQENLSNFYKKNEIFQLAFRVAKANNQERVYAIDYTDTNFPYTEVMEDIEANQQTQLQQEIEEKLKWFSADFDAQIDQGVSLIALTLGMNTETMRYESNNLHNNVLSLAGNTEQFNGALLTAEWYKRNLYMWSLVRKYTEETDERVMVLAGSSHTAMFEIFVDYDKKWQMIEVSQVLRE
ncbi:DUF5694 domain-containing protein [Flavobacterium sp. ASW18X]|uniref:DUF5694 domain-containing protein n=1 Tax=Flavobacterium sp. ASW18X TaxID=2572595 RepID=UPI0010AE99D7|nr:DUF5694 domain-containing protein [Flavobacterium sp. ASW18X]TKD63513.1 hypothetical protein FBT53_08015 [Flavobacterium sp. ASW18X]